MSRRTNSVNQVGHFKQWRKWMPRPKDRDAAGLVSVGPAGGVAGADGGVGGEGLPCVVSQAGAGRARGTG